MNGKLKWISISLIILLLGGVVVLGVLYSQKSSSLSKAEAQIDTLELDIINLEADLSAAEAEVASLEADLATAEAEIDTLETDLAAAQAEVASLQAELATAQADLATAQAEIDTLETDLAAAQAEMASLEADLATAEAEIDTLETDLAAAQAEVAFLQAELATAQADLAALSDELILIKDPRHFNSLAELQNWLAQDNTNTAYASANIYNYSYILQVRALRDGYLLPAFFEDWDMDYIADISGNLAYIVDEIYVVLPFEDLYMLWFVAPDIPSHPLPLE